MERTYDVAAAAVVPDLAGVTGVQAVEPVEESQLAAVYYDTADLRLRTADITLWHCMVGPDAGWHLKLPAGPGPEPLTVQGPDDEVPGSLAALVRARVRGRELQPVARLSTQRSVHRLLDPQRRPVAELADDRVCATPLPRGRELHWREWEVELVGGEPALLDAVQQRLTEAGAVPAGSASRLAQVAPQCPAPAGERPWWSGPAGHGGRRTAGAVVQLHLAEQLAELVGADPAVRRDVPAAVHDMRVATRRLRSALVVFGPLLDRTQTDPVRRELRWLADALGGVRDADVMHERLRCLVDAEPPEFVLGPVRAAIDEAMTSRHRTARDALVQALDGERYLQLLDTLDLVVAEPPFLDLAYGDAQRVLAATLRRSWRRLETAMDRVQRASPGSAQDELLHRVRKDAKRVRYAAEAVRPAFGRPAGRFATAMEQVQETLGDFHDGIVTGQMLRELGAGGRGSAENGFTFGRLHALEQARSELAVENWPAARAAASRRRLRRWFQK